MLWIFLQHKLLVPYLSGLSSNLTSWSQRLREIQTQALHNSHSTANQQAMGKRDKRKKAAAKVGAAGGGKKDEKRKKQEAKSQKVS